ncbi:hypothetical protein M9Y57_29595, partial [Pseudomonas putida]|nr:hypothetical protein [Pseudomonas putida]
QQHQGEPIGYVCPRALDAAINGRIGAEQISILKTPTFYINKPLYTHADPGEVERLTRKAANADLALAAQTRQVHSLRAQLAERDALLREAYAELLAIKAEIGFRGTTISLIGRIDAAISASAEPSAPDGLDPRECRKCGSLTAEKCKAGGCWFEREPSAQVEPLYQKCTVLKDAEVRYSNSTAPVERVKPATIALEQVLQAYTYADNHPHRYLRGTTNWCAAVAHSLNEQVRAALERKPS